MSAEINVPRDLVEQLGHVGINPTDVVAYVASTCNLRCKHCYIGNALLAQKLGYNEDSLLRFLLSVPDLGRLTLLGGEPFLLPGTEKILRGLVGNKISDLRVTSNLTILPAWGIELLLACGVRLSVSLDGPDASTHDQIRGKGAFERTIKNLRKVLDAGVKVEITHTVSSLTVRRLPEVLALCKRLSVGRLNLHRLSLHGNAILNPELAVSSSQWRALREELKAMHFENRTLGSDSLSVRYPVLFVTQSELESMHAEGRYHPHAAGSYYTKGQRIILYPDGKLYISSEAFGSESHIGTITESGVVFNDRELSELRMLFNNHQGVEQLYDPMIDEGEDVKAISVSYKEVVLL